jgi:hypothetical protein
MSEELQLVVRMGEQAQGSQPIALDFPEGSLFASIDAY